MERPPTWLVRHSCQSLMQRLSPQIMCSLFFALAKNSPRRLLTMIGVVYEEPCATIQLNFASADRRSVDPKGLAQCPAPSRAGCLTPLYSAVAGRNMDTLLRGENILLLDSTLADPAM